MPCHLRSAFRADLYAFVNRDGNSNTDGYYEVRSLYFDSPNWICLNEKLTGETRRFKLRIRAYIRGGRPVAPCKLEVKWRDGERVCKTGCVMNEKAFTSLRSGTEWTERLNTHSKLPSPGLASFQYLRQRFSMRPVINVQYRREALIPKLERDCRITLDEDLCAWRARYLDDGTGHRQSLIPRSYSVLEIKCGTHVPFWLDRLVRKYRLRRQTLSKYAIAVLQCYPGPASCDEWGVLE
ncbi:MAG: polyphosphate polymerase domain-containing protein [Planctomycetota bacterium]